MNSVVQLAGDAKFGLCVSFCVCGALGEDLGMTPAPGSKELARRADSRDVREHKVCGFGFALCLYEAKLCLKEGEELNFRNSCF